MVHAQHSQQASSSSREDAVSLASSAGLELFWSLVAIVAAIAGIVGTAPLTLTGVVAVALALSLLARSGTLAARWPRADRAHAAESEAVGVNFVCGIAVLGMGAAAIAGIGTYTLAPLALLVLSGLLVLDAPLEPALAAPHGYAAGAYMVVTGLVSIIVLTAAFSARASEAGLVAWAALLIASGYAISATAILRRYMHGSLAR